jgi:transcriptional regulator with XRE-family HTH domain
MMSRGGCRFGRRLVVTRLALEITEQEAAEALHITLATYRKWEKRGPSRNQSTYEPLAKTVV